MTDDSTEPTDTPTEDPAPIQPEVVADAPADAGTSAEPAKPARRSRRKAEPVAELEAEVPVEVEAVAEVAEAPLVKKPRARKAAAKADTAPETTTQPEALATQAKPEPQLVNGDSPDEPRRGGWWQRTFG